MLLLLLATLAFGQSDESGPAIAVDIPFGDRLLVQRDRKITYGEVLTDTAVGPVTVHGGRFAFTHAGAHPRRGALVVCSPACKTVLQGGQPSYPRFSPDGRWLVFTSGSTGLPSVFAMDLATEDLRQLTNVGVVRTPGRQPDGFERPPAHGDYDFGILP